MSEKLQEKFIRVAAWALLAAWILFYSYKHHTAPEDHGGIASQAWSFGEPGE
jgi:hypothetical protein